MKVRQLGRIGAALAATAATVTMLAACGGSSAKTPAANTSTPGATASGQAGIQAYISCLNKNGVTISLPSRGTGVRPSGRPSGGVRPSRSPGAGGGFGGGGFGGGGFGGGLFGDANNPPAGVSQATWSAALTACKSVQPSFGGGNGFGGGGGTAFQAYRNCLTSHGVSASAAPNSLKTSDPTVAAAEKACQPLLPTRGANPNPSPTS